MRVIISAVAAFALAVAVALWARRRRGPTEPAAIAPPPDPEPEPPRRRVAVVRVQRRTTAAGLAVATSGMVCPTCRTEYAGLSYCPRDARRLVTAEAMLEGRATGGMCPRCGRAFEPGLERCPHDRAELVTPSAYRATRKADPPATGVLGKACPVCRAKHDLSSRFCGRDGHELVVVN